MILKKLKADKIVAMKKKDEEVKTVLNIAINDIEVAMKREQKELDQGKQLKIVQSNAFMWRDSIEGAQKAGREDLVELYQKRFEIISAYLPTQMTEEEIKELAEKIVKRMGTKMKDVMPAISSKTKGKADGKLVGKIVREVIAKQK